MQGANEPARKREAEILSGKPVIIRPATEDDITRILELYSELVITSSQVEKGRSPSIDDCRHVFDMIRSMPGHELLVAEDQGVVVGTVVLLIVPNLSHGILPWARVENLVVDRRYRRRGLGKLLMDYAVARAKEAGCYKITLGSNKKRKEAHRFYRSSGFQDSALEFRRYF